MQNMRWRIVIIFSLIVIAVVYAVPNLYPDVPAVQVSTKGGAALSSDVSATIKQSLAAASIKHQPITTAKNNQSLWIRFANTDTQLAARDVIKAKVPNNYEVVASLQATTPHWLQDLGAHPMKLGLDLQGGIHFLLYVDMPAMLKERVQGDVNSMTSYMRQKDIRYSDIASKIATDSSFAAINISFRNKDVLDKSQDILERQYTDYTFKNTSSEKGLSLQALMSPASLLKINRYTMQQNMSILTNRVNALGIAEASITQQGRDHISVDLPGIQDPARAQEMIGKVASLKFQLVDTEHDAQTASNSGAPFGSQLYTFQGSPILLKNQIILKGSNIVSASSGADQMGKPSVNVRLGSGEADFHRITAENVGKPMAVVYVESQRQIKLVKGKPVTSFKQVPRIINVATIQSALPNSFQITGLDSQRYAQDLALQLRSGAYVAPISIVRNVVVGSTMGKSNIDKGVLSTIVGFLLVVIIMAIYYRLFGLVANSALFLNLVFIVAVLSIMQATLTLPGIAAIVLTIGMAVDANVLINERIREELRRGVSPLASIQAGYERAFATIVDANVTTLIVAVILFALSDTSVKSFAVNLIIGLITSMITAIFFSRTFVNMIYGKKQTRHLSIGIKVKK
jgi:preprotein translocase subunit SecD